jgi:hypothetical protein
VAPVNNYVPTTTTGSSQYYDDSLDYVSTDIVTESEILGTDFEVNITEDDQSIVDLGKEMSISISRRYSSYILSGVMLCRNPIICSLALGSVFLSALETLKTVVAQFLEGLAEGFGSSFDYTGLMDNIGKFWNNPMELAQSLWNLISNPIALIKGGIQNATWFINADLHTQARFFGKMLGGIGGEIVQGIILAVLTAGVGNVAKAISTAAKGLPLLTKVNKALSLVGRAFKGIGTVINNSGKAVIRLASTAIDKLEELSKYAVNAYQKSRLAKYIAITQRSSKAYNVLGDDFFGLNHVNFKHKFGANKSASEFLQGADLNSIGNEIVSKLKSKNYYDAGYHKNGVGINYTIDFGRNIGTHNGKLTSKVRVGINPDNTIRTFFTIK